MDAVPDTHLMAAAEQRARQWLEGDGIETAKLDFLAEDILRLVGELRDLRRASMASLHARVAELEEAVDWAARSHAREMLERPE